MATRSGAAGSGGAAAVFVLPAAAAGAGRIPGLGPGRGGAHGVFEDGGLVSAVAADGQLTVTYRSGAMTSVRIFDGKTGEMLREIPVLSE